MYYKSSEENGAKEERIESVRDIEDDAGPVFKRSRVAGAATYGW